MGLPDDDPYLHSLRVSVLLLLTSEAVLIAVPVIFVVSDFVQYFLIRRDDDHGIPALVIAVDVGFPPLAIVSIVTLVALQKGLTLRRPAYLWPFFVLKCFRLVVDIIVVCLVVVLDRTAYHLLAFVACELLLGICSLDIVWRALQFLKILQRRSNRTATPTEKCSFKKHSLSTIEEITSTV
uniref:Uncharacterized protein n=1 Tax=Plectus sambesii TaxID=2011161 RepID=A0A914UJF7_9BILA